MDSATAFALAVRALGERHVLPVMLPYGNQKPAREDGFVFNIAPLVDPLLSDDNIRNGNLMARARMMVLFDQAKKRRALVVGTENKTEHLLGYFTRFGDQASDIEPLRNLYKTQVYQLAKFLGIPQKILDRAPTAGLWEGQTDEGEFGFTYKDADEILYQYFDQKKKEEDIKGNPDVISRVLARVAANAFKHHLPLLP